MAMPAAATVGNNNNNYYGNGRLLSGGGLDAGLARPGAVQSPGYDIGSSGSSSRALGLQPPSSWSLPPSSTSYDGQQTGEEAQVRGADRLAQSLAELALAPEKDQYPIDIVLVPATGFTVRDLALRRLAAVLPPPAMLPEQQVDPHYLALLAQLARRPGAPPLPVPPGVTAGMLPQYQIEPATGVASGGRPHETPFQVVDIVKAISSGTAQGTVYDVQVMLPRASPKHRGIDLARAATAVADASLADRDVHTALVRRGPDGPVTAVHAALKKSPIYSVGTWLARAAVQRLIDVRRATDVEPPRSRRGGWWRDAFVPGGARAVVNNPRYGDAADAQLASRFALASKIVRQANGPELPPTLVAAPVSVLERLVAQMDRSLAAEFNNTNNDAYIDAVGAFLGSQLAESGVSPFFGLLYATLRATDAAFFDPNGEAVDAIGPEINTGFPVQATIMQFLDGTLGGLIKQGFFAGGSPVGPARDYQKAMALAAQVVFGLAAAQGAYGIVHNDFHNDNIAYENVPEDVMLYYRTEPGDAGEPVRYYAVPTFGKVYKMIDFGRATFRLGDEMRGADASTRRHAARVAPLWGSPTQDAVVEGDWNLRGFNNDLLRFVTVFLYNLGARADATPTGPADPWRDAFMRMARHVTSCAPPTAGPDVAVSENPLAWADRCSVLPGDMTYRRQCADNALSVRPYLVNSPCVNAVPADNVHWFDAAFGIDATEIPAGAHLYTIPV
ncbi:hypothetical protein TW95_gp1254 [Pandoravirus inopinatum]|uniref:Uncharacterized protein n=1 Tax=Pandoravirus inopinatum TaxID=1605721 RepID=A0A0B5IYM5_9VIRU|nr:hypothetical protein TW95_gp1254 [Pandoravirus inopinatum]AJF97988.1 hypothetical protein [Pandoravirus inopinatum]